MMDQPTPAEYAWAAAQAAQRAAARAQSPEPTPPLSPIRADLGFSAYGHAVTAVAGHPDVTGAYLAVQAVHQVTVLPVCTRCGATVPIPYQAQHADWHEELRRVIRNMDDRLDRADPDGADIQYPGDAL